MLEKKSSFLKWIESPTTALILNGLYRSPLSVLNYRECLSPSEFYTMTKMNSYGTRCIIRIDPCAVNSKKFLYEERITVWRANSIDESISKAKTEVARYCLKNKGMEYTGLCQAYCMYDSIEKEGVEVFSLIRESDLDTEDYLDAFFDNGDERQHRSE